MVEPNRVGGFPFRKTSAEKRKSDFSEVQQPYSEEDVMREAEMLPSVWNSRVYRCLPSSFGRSRYE